MKGTLKAVAIVVGVLAVILIALPLVTCWENEDRWGCRTKKTPITSEWETVQSAMHAMMADQGITTVTPNDNTTSSLGVNTWFDLPDGPGAASLDDYHRMTTTTFYYCWDSQGNVYTQNKSDGVTAEPEDAERQRPCKQPPP